MSVEMRGLLPVGWTAVGVPKSKVHVAERPELWVWPAAVVASLAFVSLTRWSDHHSGAGMARSAMTMPMPTTEQMKMAMPSSDGITASVIVALVLAWMAMVVAMMLPAAIPSIRYVAFTSLRRRRIHAMTMFSLGFIGVWLPGAIGAVAWHWTHPIRPNIAATVGFAVAALWELTPQKRRALQRCHRTIPIRLTGWDADRSCLGFGVLSGGRCIVSCGPAMLAVVVAGHSPATLALVTIAMFGQQLVARGERFTRPVAITFALGAVAILVI
jgi:predicted metal-binding membrane protein